MKVCEGYLSSCTILPSSGHGRRGIIGQYFLFLLVLSNRLDLNWFIEVKCLKIQTNLHQLGYPSGKGLS